jgi:glutamine synthetase
LARNHIIPTAITYQNRLLENVKGLKEVLDTKTFKAASAEQCNLIEEISERIGIINNTTTEMIEARKAANAIEDSRELAIAYDEKVKPYFDTIRYHVDKLEIIIDDELWPLPKYREMLFTR